MAWCPRASGLPSGARPGRWRRGLGLVRGKRRGRQRQRIWELEPRRLQEARRYLDRVSEQWDDALGRLRGFVEKSDAGRRLVRSPLLLLLDLLDLGIHPEDFPMVAVEVVEAPAVHET